MSRVRADRYTDRAGTGSPTFSEGVNVVGISSLGITTVTGVGQTALTVNGDARITGVLTVGQGSVTINGDSSLNTISGVTTVYTTSINDLGYPSAGPLSNRNLIINGGMAISQRGAGWEDVADVGPGDYLLDRFKTFHFPGTSGTSVLEHQQSSDVPTGQGFKTSLALRVKTAGALPNDGYMLLCQVIEGYNINPLEFGTANAKNITVSFWAKSSVTGTYSVVLRNINATRTYVKDYDLVGGTWKHVTLTFPGDTGGTWNITNGAGLQVMWAIDTGSNWNTAPDVWNTSNLFGSTNQTNTWADTASNTFHLTGVQVEVGTRATPFEHRSYGDELALCERYCQSFNGRVAIGNWNGGTGALVTRYLSPPMRATPTMHSYTAGHCLVEAVNWYSVGSVAIQLESTNSSVTFQLSSITNSGQSFNANATWGNGAAAVIHAEL